MGAMARPGTRISVIGGGLLGLEAAYGLRKSGAEVTLVHLMDRLMERQLDARAAAMLKRAVERLGITVLTSAESARIEGDDHVEALVLTDGRKIQADIVVFAVGIAPNVALARDAGVETARGILVDDGLESSVRAFTPSANAPSIAASVTAWSSRLTSRRACWRGGSRARTRPTREAFWPPISRFPASNVFSAGDFLGGPGTEDIIFSDPGLGAYKKLVLRDGRLAGAVLYGDTADGLWYLDLIREGTPVEPFRNDLIFGRAFARAEAA